MRSGTFRTFALYLDHRMCGPEARRFRCAAQSACYQFRFRFMHRTALSADHKNNRLSLSMKMVTSEI
jgi:hypothetical protein